MKTEKVLITTNAPAVYQLELDLKRERPYYDEMQDIFTRAKYTGTPDDFKEYVLKPLRELQPGVVDDSLLTMYGAAADVDRVRTLAGLIKYPDLHNLFALEQYKKEKIYEYTQNEKEREILAFLHETNNKMISLGIAKKQRIELLETFGFDANDLGLVRIWAFRDQVQKCADRVQWLSVNPGANPL